MGKRCPNGTHKNKKTGNCEKNITNKIVKNRCPKGTRKNKKTGNCDKKLNKKINIVVNFIKTPETKLKTPETKLKTPEIKLKTPETKLKTPETKLKTPETKIKTPETKLKTPETKIKTPEIKLKTPETKLKTPETKIKTPETKNLHNLVSRENYEYIKDKYGHMSSWAIWSKQNGKSKSGMDDITFFYNPSKIILDTLNPNIILVGLNISERIDRVFGNFHPDKSKAQDYKTRYAVQDTMFWGAYMTDIIKSFEEKISGNLMKYLSKNKLFEKENIKKFEQELINIGSTNPILVALGNDSYKILKRNLKKYKIYKVSHYSAYITKEKLRSEFEKLENELKQ
jgi:hypothetical protein